MNPIRIFLSYSPKDIKEQEGLLSFMTPWLKKGRAEVWHDGMIAAGEVWEESIKKKLEEADMMLMLLSENALASDHFYEIEMQRALERQQKGELVIIPILLSHCLWEDTPLASLKMLPSQTQPISAWASQDEVYTLITKEIRAQVDKLYAERNPSYQPPKNKAKLPITDPQEEAPILPNDSETKWKKTLIGAGAGIFALLILLWAGSKLANQPEKPDNRDSLGGSYYGDTVFEEVPPLPLEHNEAIYNDHPDTVFDHNEAGIDPMIGLDGDSLQ